MKQETVTTSRGIVLVLSASSEPTAATVSPASLVPHFSAGEEPGDEAKPSLISIIICGTIATD